MRSDKLSVRVEARTDEATDIVGLTLVDPTGAALPRFDAGSHIDVETPAGVVRQYSLCNPPGETHRYCIGVLRDPASRGGSRSIHEEAVVGSTLRISAPKNHFPLVQARHSVLMAGGIGITPLLAMAESLTRQDASFEMHYCCRSQGRAAFRQRIAEAPYRDRVHFHFDDGAPPQRLDIAATLGRPRPEVHLYVCGPKGFMDAVISTAKSLGWAPESIHYEYFAAAVPTSTANAFDLVLAKSGRTIRVAEGVTVLEALRSHGVDIPVSCEQGVCGTCVTGVLEGVPDHRDLYFTDEEKARNDQFTPCCSRSCTQRLVVAL